MSRKSKFMAAYMAVLLAFTVYVMLDTFVITRVYGDDAAISGTEMSESAEIASGNSEGNEAESATGSDAAESSGEDADAGNQHSGSGTHHGMGGRKGTRGKKMTSDSSSSGSSGADSGTASNDSTTASSRTASSAGIGTVADTYSSSGIDITLIKYRENDTDIYVADVKVTDSSYLKTALAEGTYGRNVTAKTSEIADSVGAVLAVNGDYYGAQEKGYVIRNGKLYRNTALKNQEDLVIYKDGSFGIINESDVTAEALISKGAVQTLSFGPALIQNGAVSVTENEEVGQAMASNPRTAIGIIDENHYVFVVSDGRTSESTGLSLYELAQFMDSLGAETAYNLDGGGSSTMYFKGSVVNNPTTGGSSTKERSVSDIVYIG